MRIAFTELHALHSLQCTNHERQVSNNKPVISIADLYKSYDQLDVLKCVTLNAKRGEIVSFIGSLGSGKSTLRRCANLLETPQKGDVLFKGEPITWKGEGEI